MFVKLINDEAEKSGAMKIWELFIPMPNTEINNRNNTVELNILGEKVIFIVFERKSIKVMWMQGCK